MEYSKEDLMEAKKLYSDAVSRYEECLLKLKSTDSSREKRKLKKSIKALEIIVNENRRFSSPEMIKKVNKAKELISHSVEELYSISEPTMEAYNKAKAMSEESYEEIKAKNKMLKEASKELDRFHKKAFKYIEARKLVKQYEYYLDWNAIFGKEVIETQTL